MTSFDSKPWLESMPEDQFAFMRDVLAAPSPVGFEAAMTEGVIRPYLAERLPNTWGFQNFVGNAGLVIDSHPGETDRFSVMVLGHADKIRMQVRHIGDDGKIWIDSDSFLPGTLLGHEVLLFSEDPAQPGTYRMIEGGTIEALGAIHFADTRLRNGDRGIKKTMLYLELQIFGDKKRQQVESLGIKPGDPIILNRPIRAGFTPDTFYGAYLDNGLGSFVAAEVARILAERGGPKNIRLLSAAAAYEEIGRMGSRVMAGEMKPDAVIAVDVNHDYVAAPGVRERRFTPLEMGKGFTLTCGSIVSEQLNSLIMRAATEHGIPFQKSVSGRDTGTDAMASVFAAVDSAATSVGFPIRNMHTISETGCTGDVLASIWGIVAAIESLDQSNDGAGPRRGDFESGHPRLDQATPLRGVGPKGVDNT